VRDRSDDSPNADERIKRLESPPVMVQRRELWLLEMSLTSFSRWA
jgi:hypothetical protein